MYVIVAGKVKVGGHARDGRESLFTVRAAPIDGVLLRAWIPDHPEVPDRLLCVFARRLQLTQDNLSDPRSLSNSDR